MFSLARNMYSLLKEFKKLLVNTVVNILPVLAICSIVQSVLWTGRCMRLYGAAFYSCSIQLLIAGEHGEYHDSASIIF